MRATEPAALRFRTDLELAFVPPRERLTDKLADALIALDDAMFITAAADAADLRAFHDPLLAMWEQINDIMKRMSD
jgi:hypothetical protein